MPIFIFFAVHWYLSFFLQSFFHHRYAAHGHFKMSRSMERFFYLACFIVHGSSYISPNAFAIMHRLHHMHTDTPDDPHSPSHQGDFFGTMQETRNSYYNIFIGKTLVDDKLRKELPAWVSFEKIAHNWFTRIIWALLYLLVYISFATTWWVYLFLPVTIALCTVQGTLINWWAHKSGYVNYPMKNTSKNILRVDLLFIGDAYHNNHHKFPGRTKNSHKWFEIDLIYGITWLMQKVEMVQWKSQGTISTIR